jgi:hypothetical protein
MAATWPFRIQWVPRPIRMHCGGYLPNPTKTVVNSRLSRPMSAISPVTQARHLALYTVNDNDPA